MAARPPTETLADNPALTAGAPHRSRDRAGGSTRTVRVPLCFRFFPRCCRNVTAANRRCGSVGAAPAIRIVRSQGLCRLVRGGPRNEPALPAADLFLHLGHACRAFD